MPQLPPNTFDDMLREWPHDPRTLNVRLAVLPDREVIQMRVDLGVLQLETTGRPDGQRPYGAETIHEHLVERSLLEGSAFTMDEDACSEVDREFMQFYHRRVCWLSLERYAEAERDANHTLALMDFCREHAADQYWTATHEHYRPLVMFHRAQAAALAELDRKGAEAAVTVLDAHAAELHAIFEGSNGVEDVFDPSEMTERLRDLRGSLLGQFSREDYLTAELKAAIDAERFEEAARLRDEINAIGDGAMAEPSQES